MYNERVSTQAAAAAIRLATSAATVAERQRAVVRVVDARLEDIGSAGRQIARIVLAGTGMRLKAMIGKPWVRPPFAGLSRTVKSVPEMSA